MLEEGLRRSDCAVSARHLDLLTRLSLVAIDAGARSVDVHARTRDPLVRELIAALPGKSDAALQSLLADQWALVRSPSMAPALLAVASEARPRGAMLRSISDLALERLVEVDPLPRGPSSWRSSAGALGRRSPARR